MKNRDIEVGAKEIAKDFLLPGGRRKKLARVVAEHLEWFDLAEARGMTWDDMIAVLAAAGVRRDIGLPLSRGALSSAVWRKRNDSRVTLRQNRELSHEARHEVSGAKPSTRSKRSSAEQEIARPSRRSRDTTKDAVRRNSPTENHPTKSSIRGVKEKNASDAVLAYMQRAARIRRRADETD